MSRRFNEGQVTGTNDLKSFTQSDCHQVITKFLYFKTYFRVEGFKNYEE